MTTSKLTDIMFRVDKEASVSVEAIIQKLLAKDPVPKADDIFIKARHINTKRVLLMNL